jgi:hypothetical protein
MSITLRRSCAACAKAKLGCDLRTPRCTRCCKRNSRCMYANEPLNSRVAPAENGSPTDDASQMVAIRLPLPNRNRGDDSSRVTKLPTSVGAGTFDPFDSYPQTTLPRMQVQSLIYHCNCLIILLKNHNSVSNTRLTNCSFIKNCFSILSVRARPNLKSIHYLLVASGSHRSCSFSCHPSNSMSRP